MDQEAMVKFCTLCGSTQHSLSQCPWKDKSQLEQVLFAVKEFRAEAATLQQTLDSMLQSSHS